MADDDVEYSLSQELLGIDKDKLFFGLEASPKMLNDEEQRGAFLEQDFRDALKQLDEIFLGSPQFGELASQFPDSPGISQLINNVDLQPEEGCEMVVESSGVVAMMDPNVSTVAYPNDEQVQFPIKTEVYDAVSINFIE